MHTGFRYRPEDHSYWLDERRLPSVTDVLSVLPNGYQGVPDEILERKRDLGTKVHLACALDDQGLLDGSTVDPAIEPYLAAWRSFRADSGFSPELIEEPGFSRQFCFGGTPDRVGNIAGQSAVVDIKTLAKLTLATAYQTWAYGQIALERSGCEVRRRFAVQLRGDMRYRVEEYRDRADGKMFLACLQLFPVWRQLRAGESDD